MRTLLAVTITLCSLCGLTTPSTAAVVADSTADFSGIQGSKNWYYGYLTAGSISVFTQLPAFNTQAQQWQHTTLGPPWTLVGANSAVEPNGANDSTEEWATREWLSNYTGPITVSGHLAKLDTTNPASTGVFARVYWNHQLVYEHFLAGTDGVGVNYSLNLTLKTGDIVDFALAPNGNDANDLTQLSASISPVAINRPAQIWFAPLESSTIYNVGPSDFMQLFAPGAAWPQAAAHVAVFKLYDWDIQTRSDTDLQQIFSFFKQHNIQAALEFQPLQPQQGCGENTATGFPVDSFQQPFQVQQTITKIKNNGGTLSYIAMDEPFSWASLYTGPGACNWSAQQIAANAAQYVATMQAAFPGVIIGDIEPLSLHDYPTINMPTINMPSDWLQRYADWIDTFQSVTGTNLAFFDLDVDRDGPNWMTDIAWVKSITSPRGIALGVIYDALSEEPSDTQWLADAEKWLEQFELSTGQPDRAIFQSWTPYPLHSLPETTPYTFTWLIDRYDRQRTALSLAAPSQQLTGILTDGTGQGISSASIVLALQPISGTGVVSTFNQSGIVPPSATTAVVGGRINNQCDACSAPTDLALQSVQYSETSAGANSSTQNFASGLKGWWLDTTGTAVVEPSASGSGNDLHISATSSQQVALNSPVFSVTPNASYSVQFTARVAPLSTGSGYFTIIFLDAFSNELYRQYVWLQSGTIPLGTVQTDANGSYTSAFVSQGAGSFQIRAAYSGTDSIWPAQASIPIDIQGLSQTIEFTAPPNQVLGAASFALNAVASVVSTN